MKRIKMSLSMLLSIIMLSSVVIGCNPSVSASDTYEIQVSGVCNYDKSNEVLKLVNEQRSKNGLGSLIMDTELLNAAIKRAMEASIYFSHIRPSGKSCFTILSKVSAENMASGYSTADDVMDLWMNSSYHKDNILNSGYKSIGIGCFKKDNVYYWVQCFSTEQAKSTSEKSGVVDKSGAITVNNTLIPSSNAINAIKNTMKQAKITKLSFKSTAKKKITVTWKKVSTAKGYQVQVASKKSFKKSKIVISRFTTKTKLNIKRKIKSGKTYYVRVRAYTAYKNKKGKSVKVYSSWNKKIRQVKVK